MTTDRERLDAMRDDLRHHQPYRPAFQEADICPVCSGHYELGPVAWPCAPVRLLAAVDAVLRLHAPIKLQEADDDGMPHEPGTGHDWPPICRECSDPDIVSTIEFGDLVDQGDGETWPCPTVAAITEALTRKEEA